MKTTLKNIEARFTNVEADSSAMKKSNFIADLMASLLDKIMDKMQEKSIDWHWYSSRELTQLKISINPDPNWINSHPLAATYGLAPGVLIDHLKIKQDRNYSTHYTKKIRTYALESEEFRLSGFIAKHAELQAISELEKTITACLFQCL
jgi:hypothetical protein